MWILLNEPFRASMLHVYEGGARGVNFSLRPSLGKILFSVSDFRLCGDSLINVPCNDLNLVTIFRLLVLPVHQDTCGTERSGQVHGSVLTTDTLTSQLTSFRRFGD